MRDGKTLEQWIQEINGYDVYSKWPDIFRILYPNMLYRNKNTLNVREDLYYQNIDVFQYVGGQEVFTAKFPYSIFQDELTQFKNAAIDEITLWFDAYAIRENLRSRLLSLDVLTLAIRLGYEITNGQVFANQLIESGNELIVSALETENIVFQQELNDQTLKDLSVKNGLNKIRFGELVLAQMITRNEAKNLTLEQFNQFVLDQEITAIERFLKNGSLKTARFLVSSKAVDDVIFLQSDKDFVLSELNRGIALYENNS